MHGEEFRLYQSAAAAFNYVALDRPDTQYAVKELMRKLSKPTVADMIALKRVARYFLGAPRLVLRYPWRPLSRTLEVYCDSDHAGCPWSRKSTSGGDRHPWGENSEELVPHYSHPVLIVRRS